MELTSAQYLQLIAGLVFVIIAFVAAYIGPERVVVTVLMLLLPFQPITSVFGTVNTGLALIVFTAWRANKAISVTVCCWRDNAGVYGVVYPSTESDLP
jgi:energy-converting hydrogenase Eha subunit E